MRAEMGYEAANIPESDEEERRSPRNLQSMPTHKTLVCCLTLAHDEVHHVLHVPKTDEVEYVDLDEPLAFHQSNLEHGDRVIGGPGSSKTSLRNR